MYQEMFKCGFYIFISLLILSDCATPPFIDKCKPQDSECLKTSAIKAMPIFADGLKEFGVEIMDPLKIKTITSSQGSLEFIINDVTATGLKKCEIQKLQNDIKNSKISVELLCSLTLEGDYVLRGSVLVVPLEGNGKVHVELKSTVFNIDLDMIVKQGDDGKDHWYIKSWRHTFDMKEKSSAVFENLYNGNEVLGRAARELIDNNTNEVIREIGAPAIKFCMSRVVKNINNFFKAVPIEDLSEQ